MHRPIVRWYAMFIPTSMFILSALFFKGGAGYISETDSTFISWIIMSMYFMGSMHLGYLVRRQNNSNIEEMDFSVPNWITDKLTSLGMLGTILGLIIMSNSLGLFDAGNSESKAEVLKSMSVGWSAALTTTFVGLHILLKSCR